MHKEMLNSNQFIEYVPKGWAVTFAVCLIVDIALLVTSFIMPPQGQIDPSVLTAAAELFAFPTLYTFYVCISKGIDTKYSINVGGAHFDVETKKKEEHKHEQA